MILVTEFVNNSLKLSPTHTVSNIRHQHRCSFIVVRMKIHEIDLIYSKCPGNSEFRSILAQSEIGFTKLINVGLFDFSCKVKCQKDLLNIFNFRQHPSDKFHYVIQILIIQKPPTQGTFSVLRVGGSDFMVFEGLLILPKLPRPILTLVL